MQNQCLCQKPCTNLSNIGAQNCLKAPKQGKRQL
jgi:hypothetical protein